MPRDGSGIYSQPFPIVEEGTTIESAVYNGYTTDVTTDLNTPRPIVAGGTGASSADGALNNIGAEKANQAVTNFDSHVWISGSFYAAPGATASPDGAVWVSGTAVVMSGNPAWVNLEACAHTGGTGGRYTRVKIDGVWSAWQQLVGGVTDTDARYVNLTGDTMTGPLAVVMASPSLALNTTGSGQAAAIFGNSSSGQRWMLRLGNGEAESGSNAGSNFDIHRYSDTGSYIGGVLTIQRSNGQINTIGNLTVGGITRSQSYYGPINFAEGGNNSIARDTVGNTLHKSDNGHYFQNGAGSVNYLAVAPPGNVEVWNNLNVVGTSGALGGFSCRAGSGTAVTGYTFQINHVDSVGEEFWVGAVKIGLLTIASDYRIKKDVIDLPTMWDTVKALRPIKYTQAEYQPLSQKKYIAEEIVKSRKEAEENPEAKPREVNTGPMFANDDTERWGFIAHELQEALTPSAATGVKDSPDTVQSPNPFTLIAALTKALQEAMARIEALEAR
jgi:hypothetical protein